MMDLEISSHRAENTCHLGLIEILKSNFGFKIIQRSVQLVMSRSLVFMADMELNFISLLHLETPIKFGWSYPEAQIATWRSYDTEIQTILLKKLITKVCRTRVKSNRLFN